MPIGLLGLGSSYSAHLTVLERLGVATRLVRRPAELAGLKGLILPGGQSAELGRRLSAAGLSGPVRAFAAAGRPVWGTCAGLVLLARTTGQPQPLLDLIDMAVERAAFGRQREVFSEPLPVPALGGPAFPGLFLRAPAITSIGPGVRVLACLADGTIVAVRQGRRLATAFHPERTPDPRFHQYFLRLCR
jgi:5'-phosphate synthase pdxT subunit